MAHKCGTQLCLKCGHGSATCLLEQLLYLALYLYFLTFFIHKHIKCRSVDKMAFRSC